MRRADRARDRAFAYGVIDRCEYGVAAFSTGEETPYCIPLSLVRMGDELYFHCALQGRKLDLLRVCPKVCVTFVADTEPAYVPEKNEYTTYFKCAWSPEPPSRSPTRNKRPPPCGRCAKS